MLGVVVLLVPVDEVVPVALVDPVLLLVLLEPLVGKLVPLPELGAGDICVTLPICTESPLSSAR